VSIFSGRHFPKEMILWAVRWYCRYGVSYRDLEEMLSAGFVLPTAADRRPPGPAPCPARCRSRPARSAPRQPPIPGAEVLHPRCQRLSLPVEVAPQCAREVR
jgi:hypothetical protein